MAAAHGHDQTVQGPLSGKIFVTGTVEAQAPQYLSSEASRLLARRIAPGSVIAAQDAVPILGGVHQPRQLVKRLSALQEMGRKYGADAVLIGFLYEFTERVGGNYGVEQPARVSFEINLVSVTTGRLVWQRRYTETQQTLNENLFELKKFIQRKGRWITAREMVTHAINEMFSTAEIF